MDSHPTSTPGLRCRDVTISLGGVPVLTRLDLTAAAGRVYALLGRNGAGKSTTIKVALGLLRPDAGSVELFGQPWCRAALARVGASVDGPALYTHLSAEQNLRVHAHLVGTTGARVAEVLALVGLGDVGRRRVARFSTGMKARLALGVALLGSPELLVLDEPQNGLDPEGIVELRSLLRELAGAGTTVLVSSHQLGEVARMADDLGVLAGGRIVYEGPLPGFAAPGHLEEAYLAATAEPVSR